MSKVDEWEQYRDPRKGGLLYRRSKRSGAWQWYREDPSRTMAGWVNCDEPPPGMVVPQAEYERMQAEELRQKREQYDAWARRPWEPRPEIEW